MADKMDVDLDNRSSDQDIVFMGMYQSSHPRSRALHRAKVMPATNQRPTRVVIEIQDSDEEVEGLSPIVRPVAASRKRKAFSEQPVAGPSRITLDVQQAKNARPSSIPPEAKFVPSSTLKIQHDLVPKPEMTTQEQVPLSASKYMIISDSSEEEEEDRVHPPDETANVSLDELQCQDIIGNDRNDVEDEDEVAEDYDTLHAGYNINDHSIWNKLLLADDSENFDDSHDTAADLAAAALALSEEARTALKRYSATSRISQRTEFLPPRRAAQEAALFPEPHHHWSKIREVFGNTPFSIAFDRFDSKTHTIMRHGPLSRFLNLRQCAHKRFSPGPISNISQAPGMVAVASYVLFNPNTDEDASRIYNRDASLKLMCGNQVIPVEGHLSQTPQGVRYHTVNQAHFDPLEPYRLVSCGDDGRVNLWDCSEAARLGQPNLIRSFEYDNDGKPLGVSFKPGTSLFAAWGSQGHVCIHQADAEDYLECIVPPLNDLQPIQAVAWGREMTNNLVFATSASETWNRYIGFHKAFDIEKDSLLYCIKNDAGGECIDVSSRGDSLALVTCGEGQRFELSIYDIRSNLCRGKARNVELDRLPRWYEETEANSADASINKLPSSINQVSYSSDDVYVALARSDNSVHVYDSRYITRVLYRFLHDVPTEGTLDDAKYGVYRMQWMDDPNVGKLSLVSAGADGCVRLWDLSVGRSRLQPNGAVIGKSDAYISWFSLGDQTKAEKPLVLGDGAGTIVIRDLDHE